MCAKRAHERRAVERLELVQLAAVDDAAQDVAHVVGHAGVERHEVEEAVGVLGRRPRRRPLPGRAARRGQRGDDGAHDARARARRRRRGGRRRRSVRAWTSPPPSSSAVTSSPVAAFTSGGPPRKIVPCPRTMTVSSLIGGHVGAARRARAHHAGDLRDARRGHRRLVEEDAPEVLAVGEDLVLHRQERAARVHEVDARQAVVQRHLLRAQVLLDRHGVVGAALDRGVVGDDHAAAAVHRPDAGDDAGRRRVAVVELLGGERRELEERRAGIAEQLDALAHEQLAARRRGARGPRSPPPARARARGAPRGRR